MINLTTSCGKSDTLLAALLLTLFVTSNVLGQIEEIFQEQNQAESEVSVLESSDGSKAAEKTVIETTQNNLLEIKQDLDLPNVSNANESGLEQQLDVPDTISNNGELVEPEVLLRAPLHEAFADAHQADPLPNPIVNATPPEAIQEVPPEFKPEGNNVEWIPGYWAWDDSQNDFIWISGVWRDVPPNQRWVPGYWESLETGYRWIAGFWSRLDQQELNYLPAPPASLDLGPSVAAPSDDYFYCPGNWVYQNNIYVWRAGHWQPRVADWIWIPARYIWTPRGCIYRPGYWDREFDVRGVLFAPVHFQRRQYLAANFSFRPAHCVNTGAAFFVHLFVRPNCNHYFYGDWYGQNFANWGFRPWVHPRSHVRYYDPLFVHYNCSRFRRGSQLLISWVNTQHRHYLHHQNHRPRNTFQAQINFAKSTRDNRHKDFIKRANLGYRYNDVVRVRSKGNKVHQVNKRDQRIDNPNFKKIYVKTDRRDQDQQRINERIQREIRNTRKSGEKRSKKTEPLVQDKARQQLDKKVRNLSVEQRAKKLKNGNSNGKRQVVSRKDSGQKSKVRNGDIKGNRDIVQSNKLELPKIKLADTANVRERVNKNGLPEAQLQKASRDAEKAARKREVERKIAAAKLQADIKRKQRDTARELSNRQRLQRLDQARQKTDQKNQTRQTTRNQNLSQGKNRIEQSRVRATNSQSGRKPSDELRKKKQQAQRKQPSNPTNVPKVGKRSAQGNQKGTTQLKTDLKKRQRSDVQNRSASNTARHSANQQSAQVREASRQREIQRQREKVAKAQTAARKQSSLQTKAAREKSQRDAARLAAQQRTQQKAQADAQRRAREKSQRDAARLAAQQRTQQKAKADAQRRAREKSQRDAQRQAANQARRAADAARKRQREQEQAARRAKRKKK